MGPELATQQLPLSPPLGQAGLAEVAVHVLAWSWKPCRLEVTVFFFLVTTQ